MQVQQLHFINQLILYLFAHNNLNIVTYAVL